MSIAHVAHDHEPRFLSDVNFNARIVVGLRRIAPTVDLITAQSAGFHTTPDPELLAEARQLNRILLTHDVNTMPDHFATFLASLAEGEHSPGVMLVAQELAIGIAIQELYEYGRAATMRNGAILSPTYRYSYPNAGSRIIW